MYVPHLELNCLKFAPGIRFPLSSSSDTLGSSVGFTSFIGSACTDGVSVKSAVVSQLQAPALFAFFFTAGSHGGECQAENQ